MPVDSPYTELGHPGQEQAGMAEMVIVKTGAKREAVGCVLKRDADGDVYASTYQRKRWVKARWFAERDIVRPATKREDPGTRPLSPATVPAWDKPG